MGTNYYYKTLRCEKCGRGDERLHIGKSSAGWCFALRVYPGERIALDSLDDWDELLRRDPGAIENEYGETVSRREMLATITERQYQGNGSLDSDWFRENHAMPGPYGLARHIIDGTYCIGHGSGTWDLCAGEFC